MTLTTRAAANYPSMTFIGLGVSLPALSSKPRSVSMEVNFKKFLTHKEKLAVLLKLNCG